MFSHNVARSIYLHIHHTMWQGYFISFTADKIVSLTVRTIPSSYNNFAAFFQELCTMDTKSFESKTVQFIVFLAVDL